MNINSINLPKKTQNKTTSGDKSGEWLPLGREIEIQSAERGSLACRKGKSGMQINFYLV